MTAISRLGDRLHGAQIGLDTNSANMLPPEIAKATGYIMGLTEAIEIIQEEEARLARSIALKPTMTVLTEEGTIEWTGN